MSDEVEDIITKGAEVAFVLESPHVAEVAHEYPACGETGREMSRVILGRYDIPLGLVAKHPGICKLLNLQVPHPFSIINVSRRPMQEEAYSKNNLNPPSDIADRMKLKELIEKGADLNTQHEDSALCRLRDSIYAEFKKNGGPVLTGYRLVIPCGRFARLFVMHLKQQQKDLFAVFDEIAHPSRGGWKELDQDTQHRLRACIGLP